MLKTALERFGGRNLTDTAADEKLNHAQAARSELDARLKAINVDLDVMARRHLKFR